VCHAYRSRRLFEALKVPLHGVLIIVTKIGLDNF
jgi:hypothetical protein